MQNIKIQKGFTLVETLVAITVLLLAISGPLTIATNSLIATQIAKDQLTANLLAQEGIELVRWQRDTNILAGNDWLNLFNQCSTSEGCIVDVVSREFRACGSTCEALNYSESSSLYLYGSGESSGFTRKVWYEPVSGVEIRVVSEVAWTQKSNKTKTFRLEESLFNWQQ
jgi:prepilin-type N-terminal cleavage/methylation domain-containing protein